MHVYQQLKELIMLTEFIKSQYNQTINTSTQCFLIAGEIGKPVAETTYHGLKYSIIGGGIGCLVGAHIQGAELGFIYGVAKSIFFGKHH